MTPAGGIGPYPPLSIPHFNDGYNVAAVVVAVEILAISYIRNKYMDTPFLSAGSR